MSKFGYFKLQSEIDGSTKIGEEVFDFTDQWIIKVDPEMYEYQFEKLLLEYGKPINDTAICWDFINWLYKEKGIEAGTAEYNWVDNYTELIERKERGKSKKKVTA